MLIKRNVALVKIEATYNVDPTPTPATDSILVEGLSWSFTNQRMTADESTKNTLGSLMHRYGGSLVQVSFSMKIKGSGAAGTAPELGVPLRACSCGEAIVASTSVTYEPVSTGFESMTMYYYEDGKRYIFTGLRGTATASLKSGQPGMISFTMTGHFGAKSDTAIISPTYDSAVAPIVVSGGFTVDSYAAVISELSMDMGINIITQDDMNSADSYGEVLIGTRDVKGNIDPIDTLIASKDFIDDWETGSVMALTTGLIGAAGNQYQLSMPAISYRDVSVADRNGVRSFGLPFGAAETTGDNEFSLVFT